MLVRRTTPSRSKPSRPGSITSRITRSGANAGSRSSRSRPSAAASTVNPCAVSAVTTGSRIASLSSTIRMRAAVTGQFLPAAEALTAGSTLTFMGSSASKRVAILGAGMIGEVHRRAALLAGATVVGVMASSPERSRQVARVLGGRSGVRRHRRGRRRRRRDRAHLHAERLARALCRSPDGGRQACALREASRYRSGRCPAGVRGGEKTGVVNTVPFTYRFHPDGPGDAGPGTGR